MNWHPQEWYAPSRFGVHALILIECCAALVIALAAAWIEFLT